jgi:regulation of enolase protein 1 (concanavalin A-like superfamily)
MNSSPLLPDLGQFEGQTDVGLIQRLGICEYDRDRQAYRISGAGANIWDDQDAFHFVWKRMRGNFIVTLRAAFTGPGTHPHRKLGWMARTSLEPDSAHVSAALYADGLAALQFRKAHGSQTEEIRSDMNGADVIQLERKDRTFRISVAQYGQPFVDVQVEEINLGPDLYVGLFVCSHQDQVLEQVTFQDVRLVVPVAEGFERGRDPFGSKMEILDLASGHRKIVFSAGTIFEAPNWTHDGHDLIFNQDGRLYRFVLETGEINPIDTGGIVRNNNDHVLSFDGSRLAISSHGEQDNLARVYTVPAEGGSPTLITPGRPSYLHGWSPDGNFLVYTGLRNGDYDIYRIPSAGGTETQLTTAIGLDDGPEYTPDGKYIYFNSVRSGSMQIWRMQPDGSRQEQVTDDEYNNWFPHISPDGKRVAFVTYLINEAQPGDHPPAKRVYLRVMPVEGGKPKVIAYLYGGQGTMNVPSWSPDGKRLAFVSNTVPFNSLIDG